MNLEITELLKIGFFAGLGWFLSKAVFVIIISKWVVKKPITLETDD